MRIPNEHAPRNSRLQATSPALFAVLSLALASLTSCGTLRPRGIEADANPASPEFAAAQDDTFKFCPVETVRQPSDNSGGLAALASVMRYWEHDADIDELAKKYPAESESGYPLLQLRRIATKEGLIAFALTMKDRPLDQISEQLENGRPVIAPVHLPHGRSPAGEILASTRPDIGSANPDKSRLGENWQHHYVVIFGQSDQQFLVMDPAYGIIKIDKSDLTKYWSEEKNAALLCSSF